MKIYNSIKSFFRNDESHPSYEPRDKLETEISKILPDKHLYNIKGSHLTVEVFHKSLSDERLQNVEKVINNTLKSSSRFFDTEINNDANFRIFMLENKDQFFYILKKIHNFDLSGIMTGFTINNNHPLYIELSQFSASDIFLFLSESDDQIDYHISHEFTHCIQFLKLSQSILKGLVPDIRLPVFEGNADFVACEKTLNGFEKNVICESHFKEGTNQIKSENLSLYNIYYGYYNQESPFPYTTGIVASKFFNDRYPEIIAKQFHCTSQGDHKCHHDLQDKIWEISTSGEFSSWISDEYTKYYSTDNIMYSIFHNSPNRL